jgi:hypothetical protein
MLKAIPPFFIIPLFLSVWLEMGGGRTLEGAKSEDRGLTDYAIARLPPVVEEMIMC